MLTRNQCGRVEVVLVSPRNPLNIGAAARAMANFGFRRLAVVAPYEAHWREAKSAVGAPELLEDAKQAESLAQAVRDCTLVVGTGTLERRKAEQRVVALPELASLVQRELERGGRVALVFGSEKRGLTRDDLALCHVLAVIPTDKRQPSMNLGQAVAVCLYELGARELTPLLPKAGENVGQPHGTDLAPATARDLELLEGVVDETMQAARYSPAEMREANRHDMRLLLRRLALSRRDARRILGLLRRMLWQMEHPARAEESESRKRTRGSSKPR